jgi:hypothetical protein
MLILKDDQSLVMPFDDMCWDEHTAYHFPAFFYQVVVMQLGYLIYHNLHLAFLINNKAAVVSDGKWPYLTSVEGWKTCP